MDELLGKATDCILKALENDLGGEDQTMYS